MERIDLGDEALAEHLFNHHDTDVEGCDHCAVRPLMREIHFRWNNGTAADRALIWSLQDGYGVAGYTPPQGHDWSGIRDSSPEATRAIYEGLIGGIGPVVKDGKVIYDGSRS